MTTADTAASGPRMLLRRLREVMASSDDAQSRLNQIVKLIAQSMVAEVCSIYLIRAGDLLELFATEGLKSEAVHRTSLRVGEGLVGEIAARGIPLNLTDAQSHPNFAYRPETGEEMYHSFMGVPIVRQGRVIGVLDVQNASHRAYTEEELEALQTVAMVMAEFVGSGELVDRVEVHESTFAQGIPPKLDGVVLAEGVSLGIAVLHEPRVEITKIVSESDDEELQRLDVALEVLRNNIEQLLAETDLGIEGDTHEVLEVYRMFARDRGWIERIKTAIQSGLTAEAAVQRVQVENRRRMASIKDHYLRERFSDLDDLANRLIRHLLGSAMTGAADMPDDAIVIARNLGPAELLDYDRDKLSGVVLAEGAPNTHLAVLARAIGIPVLGRVEGIVGLVDPGDRIIVDGDESQVLIQPTSDVVETYQGIIAFRAERRAEFAKLKDLPAQTVDGTEIKLNMNGALSGDIHSVHDSGADGIGLFRTEFQFMISATLPKLDAQREVYSAVFEAAGDKPVVFRTLDIGSDKVVPFIDRPKEENPAMGWRGIRMSIDRPALLRLQIRALLQAADGRPLHLMFPLVSDVREFLAARDIVLRELGRHKRADGNAPSELLMGTMFEVPVLAFQLDNLLPLVDFVSVGSNDLMQFMFASDRSNPLLANRYDLISPGMLSFLKFVFDKCRDHGVPVTVCGEAAGQPIEAMCLIGLGLRSISMPPAQIGPVKAMIRNVDLGRFTPYLDSLLSSTNHSLRAKIRDFARDHNIPL